VNNRLFYISFIRAISVIMIIAFHYNGVILNFHSDSPTVFSNFFPNFDLGEIDVEKILHSKNCLNISNVLDSLCRRS
jgi:ABC-type amino acid transport system permease subunit